MAKGVSLNPGADPTLVAAATRAAMANVPKDLSGTFEAMTESYQKTMQSIGQTWAEVAKVGGQLASEAISTYTQNKKYDAMGIGIQNKEGTSFLYDKLKETRQGLKDTWFNPVRTKMVDGVEVPLENWRDLNRAKRLGLQQDKAKLEAQIVDLNSGYNNIATRLETGDYNQAATGSNWDLINAIGAYKSSSGKTKDGNYVKPDMDENGDIFFTLYGNDDNPIQRHGENITVKTGDIEKLLPANNEKAVKSADTLFKGLETSGKTKGRNYAMDGKVFRKNFGKLAENENDMHILMNEDLYMIDQTFFQDVTNSSMNDGGTVTSATIWSAMGGILPKNSKGETLDIDITGGTDPNALDAGDFQNEENYNKLAGALLDRTNPFYNKEVTKEAFLDWAHRNGESAFNYGVGMRAPSPGSGFTKNPFTTGVSFKLSDDKGKSVNITKSKDELFAQRSAVLSGQPFEGALGNYPIKDGVYMFDGKPISQYDILVQEKLKRPGDNASELGGTQIGKDTQDDEGFYDISVMELDDSTLKEKIVTDHGFTVNKNISGIYDAGVEVIEIVAENGTRQIIYLQGEKGTTKETELKKLNDFIKANKNFG